MTDHKTVREALRRKRDDAERTSCSATADAFAARYFEGKRAAYDEALAALDRIEANVNTIPCVCCGKPSDTETEDGADMCWPCMAGFLSAEYSSLKERFKSLIQRDYPSIDVESAMDVIKPLPDRIEAVETVTVEELAKIYTGAPFPSKSAISRMEKVMNEYPNGIHITKEK